MDIHQIIELARKARDIPFGTPCGVATDGHVYVVGFGTGEEWNSLHVQVDPVTDGVTVLSDSEYGKILPSLNLVFRSR